jgi:hypothetical protein
MAMSHVLSIGYLTAGLLVGSLALAKEVIGARPDIQAYCVDAVEMR